MTSVQNSKNGYALRTLVEITVWMGGASEGRLLGISGLRNAPKGHAGIAAKQSKPKKTYHNEDGQKKRGKGEGERG